MNNEKLTYEQRKKLNADKARALASKATKNGIRVTFSTKPVEGEMDFAKALRRSLKEEENARPNQA